VNTPLPTYTHRVRYHETDAQGYVFNGRYLEFVDVGMVEFVRAVGYPYDDLIAAGADPSVVRAEVDFRKPARFDDLLDLKVACTHVGTSSFRLRTAITRGPEVIAIARLVYVNVDPTAEAARPLPEEFARKLREIAVVDDGDT
jgi:acyl-CoA thioester hydrolase